MARCAFHPACDAHSCGLTLAAPASQRCHRSRTGSAGLARRIASLTPSTRRPRHACRLAFATLYLAGTAWFHARDLFRASTTSRGYTLAAHMLARGRLWMPHIRCGLLRSRSTSSSGPVYNRSLSRDGTAERFRHMAWLALKWWCRCWRRPGCGVDLPRKRLSWGRPGRSPGALM